MVAVSSTPIPQSLLATSAAALASDAGSVGTHGARSAWGSSGQWRFETPNRDAGSAAGNIGHSPQPAPFASMMIKLLGRAVAALDSDVAVAKDCIVQASALLLTAHNRADRDDAGAVARLALGGLAPWQVQRVTKHIDGALASTIRAHDCASIARLSTGYFSRAFKASFGEKFSSYVIRRRIERAQAMLMLTEESLSQIALSCGFADQSHFSRLFRREVKASPANWRRQRRVVPAMQRQ